MIIRHAFISVVTTDLFLFTYPFILTRPLFGDENRACKLAGFHLSTSLSYSLRIANYREVF
jgi:hypothetical protein